MNTKFTLAIIALVGIGVFALPSTMSLFAGQHTFYNIDATGNQVPCQKCHGDVKAELGGSMATNGSGAPHNKFQCEYCHRAEAGFAAGDDAYATIRYRNLANESIRVYLATTYTNFEAGNFPKFINYTAGAAAGTSNVDTWEADNIVWQIDGVTAFKNNSALLDEAGEYAGSLATGGTVGDYEYYDASPTALRQSNGDLKPGMTDTIFDVRVITWTGPTTAVIPTGSGSNAITPGQRYHAASLVSCMECHGGEQKKGAAGYEVKQSQPYNHRAFLSSSCGNCHYGGGEFTGAMAAGGFQDPTTGLGLTTGNASEGSVEAHNEFVVTDGNGVLRSATLGYGANNIACVACHTHVAVDINFQKAYKVAFNASSLKTGEWNVGGFQAEGNVNVSVYGNGSGLTYATGDKSYTWDGASMYVNGATTKANIALNQDTGDDLTSLTN